MVFNYISTNYVNFLCFLSCTEIYGIKQDLIYKIINGLLERLDEVSDLAVKMTGK